MIQEKSYASYGKDFYDWLLQQQGRNDPVGELAAALRRNNVPPPEDYDPFRNYTLHRSGGRQAFGEWLDRDRQAEPRDSNVFVTWFEGYFAKEVMWNRRKRDYVDGNRT